MGADNLILKAFNKMFMKNAKYLDISENITLLNGANIIAAYAENGQVFIDIDMPTGKTGVIYVAKVPLKYAPRVTTGGNIVIRNSYSDVNKLISCRIDAKGEVSIWLDVALTYPESVNFTYPLRFSGGGVTP